MLETLRMPSGIIFDWDNTLADGWLSIQAAMNATRAAFGQMPEWSLEEAKRNCTRALRDSFPEWFGADWHRARDIFYEVIHKTHLDCLRAIDGAGDLLDWLHEREMPLFIVSTKRGDVLRDEVSKLGWDRYFLSVVGAMDTEKDKPARDSVDLALKKSALSQRRNEVWFVGDKEIDVVCARNGGCVPVLVHDLSEAKRLGITLAFSDCHALHERLILLSSQGQ